MSFSEARRQGFSPSTLVFSSPSSLNGSTNRGILCPLNGLCPLKVSSHIGIVVSSECTFIV